MRTRENDSGKKGFLSKEIMFQGKKYPRKNAEVFCTNSFSISKELFDRIYIWDNLIRNNVDENNTNYICGGKVKIK